MRHDEILCLAALLAVAPGVGAPGVGAPGVGAPGVGAGPSEMYDLPEKHDDLAVVAGATLVEKKPNVYYERNRRRRVSKNVFAGRKEKKLEASLIGAYLEKEPMYSNLTDEHREAGELLYTWKHLDAAMKKEMHLEAAMKKEIQNVKLEAAQNVKQEAPQNVKQ